MITLSELKYYNKITTTEKDLIFQSCIDEATSNIGSKCSRSFGNDNHVEYFNFDNRGYYSYCCEDYYPFRYGNSKQAVFLGNLPVQSITAIEKLDNNEYVTIFNGSDTISDSTILNASTGEVSLINGYSFPYGSNSTRITYKAGYKFSQLSGTVSNDANSRAIVGVGTSFKMDFAVGDYILIGNERKAITAIADDTHLTVGFNFIEAHSNSVYYINNYPDDLRKFCKELATWIYYQSPQSDLKILGTTAINQGGQASTGKSFAEPNWTDIINFYRIWNV